MRNPAKGRLTVLNFEFGILFFLIWNLEFEILNFEFWNLEFGIFGFWIRNFNSEF